MLRDTFLARCHGAVMVSWFLIENPHTCGLHINTIYSISMNTKPKQTLNISIDFELYRRLKTEAASRLCTMGKLATILFEDGLASEPYQMWKYPLAKKQFYRVCKLLNREPVDVLEELTMPWVMKQLEELNLDR